MHVLQGELPVRRMSRDGMARIDSSGVVEAVGYGQMGFAGGFVHVFWAFIGGTNHESDER